MQSKPESGNQLKTDRDEQPVQPYSVHSEPWWRNIRYNTVSQGLVGLNASNLSSPEGPNGSMSNDDQSMSNGGMNEEDDDASKESQATASSRSVLNGGQEYGNVQHVAPGMVAVHDEGLTQPTQLELVGHSIACSSHPYQEPFYCGLVTPYGHQPLGYPFVGMNQARMPLPNEIAQEPVYVNAKQYQGILRRRQARAKAELEKKLIKVRKPYLHESRHQHAMRRPRGSGGRFAKKGDGSNSKNTTKGMADDFHPVPSSQSGSSSGSEPTHSESAEMWNFTHGHQELRAAQMQNTTEAGSRVNGSSCYQSHSALQASMHHLHSGEEGDDGNCTGQQRVSISSNQATQRPLAIQ